MSWAVDQSKKLRTRQDEVEYLRDEEEDQCLGEMPLYGYSGESHTSKVA
jgi:hypothetical protein